MISTTEPCSRFSDNRYKASELFASKGFKQVGMRELASALGLSPGALYHHYPSKQHLLFDLIEEFYEELIASLHTIRFSGVSNTQLLKNVVASHLQVHRELPWHYRLADYEFNALMPHQQICIIGLRRRYHQAVNEIFTMERLYSMFGAPVAVDVVCNLLNALPTWISSHGLSDEEIKLLIPDIIGCTLQSFSVNVFRSERRA